jgi:hypothetical protein
LPQTDRPAGSWLGQMRKLIEARSWIGQPVETSAGLDEHRCAIERADRFVLVPAADAHPAKVSMPAPAPTSGNTPMAAVRRHASRYATSRPRRASGRSPPGPLRWMVAGPDGRSRPAPPTPREVVEISEFGGIDGFAPQDGEVAADAGRRSPTYECAVRTTTPTSTAPWPTARFAGSAGCALACYAKPTNRPSRPTEPVNKPSGRAH